MAHALGDPASELDYSIKTRPFRLRAIKLFAVIMPNSFKCFLKYILSYKLKNNFGFSKNNVN
jgi:hypothetical protein